ncbi:sugar porter family MFS transporter [Acinetobacter populi]|uniref:Major facilitator superfamily (MFS) profile domain-containing protein n=1 Tax=Acinetobacter populi TaxID=1582270 RepID=A0A1Z9YUV7_9GAMM|nr:sugar porter family MFS transporter [Acinetobacter populi]OUY05991.1 hypothetical protein CAP51_14865 [Acinetobacter populi]
MGKYINFFRQNIAVFYAILIASVAGFSFGMENGIVSGALSSLKKEFLLSSFMEGWVVGSLMVGAIIGTIISAPIATKIGRRKTLIFSALCFLISVSITIFTWNVLGLIIGRMLLGFSVGMLTFSAPLYISEIAPEKYRGRAISTFQFMISFGVFFSYFSNWSLHFFESWRLMYSALYIPGILLLIGSLIVPKSPRWLIAHGNYTEAFNILCKLGHTKTSAKNELDQIKETIASTKVNQGLQLFLNNKYFRKSVFLGVSLQTIQQLTGVNIILIFGPKIFELAGFNSDSSQLFSTLIIGLFFLLSTFMAIFLVDRLGRKPLLYIGFITIILGLAFLSIGILYLIPIVSIISIIIFIVGFGTSAGPVIWTLCSEIQPSHGREFGVSCSTLSNWAVNSLIATYFLVLNDIFGIVNILNFLVLLNIFFLLIFYFFVPETKNISLETIESNLLKGKKLRNIGL